MGGRFVSEFGLHAFPDIRTLKVFVPNEADRHPTSRVMDRHNKSQGAESKIGRYLWSNFRLPRTMESFIYLSQLLQAEALDYAIIHWRREWKGCGQEYNAGSINWQLNDSNPTTSWSLVDFYLRRKVRLLPVSLFHPQLSIVPNVSEGQMVKILPVDLLTHYSGCILHIG